MTITELEAKATARALGHTMVEPCDAVIVRVLCDRLREAMRGARNLVHYPEAVLGWTPRSKLTELIKQLEADL